MTDENATHAPLAPLYAALAKAQLQYEPYVKDAVNPHFRSRYGSLAALHNAVQRALNNEGLSLTGNAIHRRSETREDPILTRDGEDTGKTRTVHFQVWLVRVILAHASGAELASEVEVPVDGWQKAGSAITYARRYLEGLMLGTAPDDDDDGNEADHRPPQPRQQPRPPADAPRKPETRARQEPPKEAPKATSEQAPKADPKPKEEPKAETPETRRVVEPEPPKEEPKPEPKPEAPTGPLTAGTRRVVAEHIDALISAQGGEYTQAKALDFILARAGKRAKDLTESDGLDLIALVKVDLEERVKNNQGNTDPERIAWLLSEASRRYEARQAGRA